MSTKHTIMIQIAEHEWTLEALHHACRVVQSTAAEIVLVQMIPVQHPGWLGTDLGYMRFTQEDQANFYDYQTILEDYGVEFSSVLFQYSTLPEASVQAAEHVNAQLVFAQLPESIFPFWTKFQQWWFRRQLAHHQCQWIQHSFYDADISATSADETLDFSHIFVQHTR